MSWAHQFGGITALNGTNSSIAITFSSAVSVGQLICWGCGYYNAAGVGTTFAATDTLSNTYVTATLQKYLNTNNHAMTSCGYSIVANSGTPTLTCTLTGTGGSLCLAYDVYAESGTATYGSAVGGYTASGTATASSSLTLSGASNWLVWAMTSSNSSGGANTAGTGLTKQQTQTPTAPQGFSEDGRKTLHRRQALSRRPAHALSGLSR